MDIICQGCEIHGRLKDYQFFVVGLRLLHKGINGVEFCSREGSVRTRNLGRMLMIAEEHLSSKELTSLLEEICCHPVEAKHYKNHYFQYSLKDVVQ